MCNRDDEVLRGSLGCCGRNSFVSELVLSDSSSLFDIGTTDREKLQKRWGELQGDIPLAILDSPYRSVVSRIVDFVSEYEDRHPDVLSTVIIPAFVTRNWWESILHNQIGFFLKAALRAKKSRVVTTVRYYL
jgi:hypothetical protein